jgi:NAD(P)-dependent dehydrogenase (short-subunit alcohol dehydrogenase family)
VKEFEGKSIVVTGSGSGLGRAAASLFAEQGGRVVCADIRTDWNEETVRLIEQANGTARGVTCDVSSSSDVANAVRTAVDSYGRLDVMFNNAGIASPHRHLPLADHSDEDFARLVDVNCRGAFYGSREAMRQFRDQGDGGVIVNTGSIAGMVAIGSVLYGGTKAFIIQLTRALAIEAAPLNVRVNCVCPGGMPTNFARSDADHVREPTVAEVEAGKSLHPLGKIIDPYDVAWAVLFLASEKASNVTGVALPVDGGYVAK